MKLADRTRKFPNCQREAMHHNHPNEPERRTIKRHTDEPRLEVGTTIEIKAGVIGVVVARYTPSGGRNEVHYIVEVRPGKTGRS